MCHSFRDLERNSLFPRPEDTMINWLQRVYLVLPPLFHSRYCRSALEGFITSGLSASAENFIRDSSKGDDGFIVSLRAMHVDKFSLSFAGNWVCLSLSRHQCAAAAHQIGTEREHCWTAGYQVQYPTQVSPFAHWKCWKLTPKYEFCILSSKFCCMMNVEALLKCHISILKCSFSYYQLFFHSVCLCDHLAALVTYDFSLWISSLSFCVLGTGVSTLFPGQCPVRCIMGQKPQCRECIRAADGPDLAPVSSGTSESLQPTPLFP